MNPVPLLKNRYVRIAGVALVLLFFLLALLAPAAGQKTSGSTYNRAPEGYLGWYAYMESQGTSVQRWRRPVAELLEQPHSGAPQTLVRIYSGMVSDFQAWDRNWLVPWLSAGNTFIALGLDAEIVDVPFTARLASDFGEVVVKTRRRTDLPVNSDRNLLGDEHGAVVWERRDHEDGRFIVALTPHLAANAYHDEPGNYAFLADLVAQAEGPIWVDEYLHGFKEADVIVEETVNSWGAYLARTPIKIALIQIAILLAIFLLSQNRRLGTLTRVKPPKVDNSRAYIEALAAVLHKAESTSFLVDMITKAERSRLQNALGFHAANIDDEALQNAWTQQTGQSQQLLTPLINPPSTSKKGADATLKSWLEKLQRLRQTVLR
ncbi:MAG: DUF4350 domain-containing protein [Leptolyngbya sp. SIOISBB]|nr:DUF4350 domain-containing protein [Leptolyngbya sp. SIOISBB]